jgi:hypothetical protein
MDQDIVKLKSAKATKDGRICLTMWMPPNLHGWYEISFSPSESELLSLVPAEYQDITNIRLVINEVGLRSSIAEIQNRGLLKFGKSYEYNFCQKIRKQMQKELSIVADCRTYEGQPSRNMVQQLD